MRMVSWYQTKWIDSILTALCLFSNFDQKMMMEADLGIYPIQKDKICYSLHF